MSVPKIIQQDMYAEACRYLGKVYPDVDKQWVRTECAKVFLKNRYGLMRLQYPWPPTVRIQTKATIQMDVAFPDCRTVLLGARRLPPGVVSEELEKPLTLDLAQERARRVLDRFIGDLERAKSFKAVLSGEAQANYDCFRFVEFADSSDRIPLTAFVFHVRRSDGFIQRCDWYGDPIKPKIPFEKVAKMAKAIPKGEGRSGELRFDMQYRAGLGTPMWIYEVPALPGGWPTKTTWWDATTGDLLFSVVLRGGTAEKPYQNPKYFTAVTDAVIQRNIEKLIKDRVAELEKKRP